MQLDEIIQHTSVMPVIVIDRVEDAVPVAKALVAGGIRTLEVTLRTAAALEGIRAIKAEVPDAIIGAGTITNVAQLHAVIEAGAQFGVSPGSTPELLEAIRVSELPFFPGVATPSEVMRAMDYGFKVMKLVPATVVGGLKMLQALGGPFPDVKFCPTGGVSVENAPDFFKLSNVVCVGGSWLTPKEAVAAGDWAKISALARAAAALKLA